MCSSDLVANALDLFSKLKFSESEMHIVRLILKEIAARLGFMNNVGLKLLRAESSGKYA